MAKRGNKRSARRGGPGPAAGVAERDSRVSGAGASSDDAVAARPEAGPSGFERPPTSKGHRRGFFDVYKPGQGYHTRLGSAAAVAVLVLWFAYFLFQKLGIVSENPNTAKLWQVGVSVSVIVVFGLLGYWLLALNKTVCDFLIATEGEMKKVNWSTRKDIIGSTKVVVLMVLFMGSLLFVVDLFFMAFFNSIGVLKGGSFVDNLRELF